MSERQQHCRQHFQLVALASSYRVCTATDAGEHCAIILYAFPCVLCAGDPPVINSFIATPSLVRASINVDCEIDIAPNDALTEFEDIDIIRVSNGLNASMLGDRFTFTRIPGTGRMVTARLTVMDGIKADNGDYRCVVSTVQGSANMTATVNFSKMGARSLNVVPLTIAFWGLFNIKFYWYTVNPILSPVRHLLAGLHWNWITIVLVMTERSG